MKSITGAMSSHLDGVVTSICTCWKITRTDGEILGFTDHDQSFTMSGVHYEASSGYYRTAISNSADSSVDNLDVSGFLDDDSLSEVELRNGAYDYAQVEVFAINWQDLSQEEIRLRYGYFGEVMIVSSGFFKVELRGLTQLFAMTIGETYSPECRADLGDHRCKIELVPQTRRSGAPVAAGTRVIVPQTPGANINLKLSNAGFETINSLEAYGAWTGDARIIWNGPPTFDNYDAKEEFFLAPLAANGSTVFTRTRSQVGTAAGRVSFMVETETSDIASAPRIALRMYWANLFGVSYGGDHDVTSSWFNLPLGAASFELTEADFPEPAPASTGTAALFYWQVIWENMPTDALTVENIKIKPYPMILDNVPGVASLSPTGLPLASLPSWVLTDDAQVAGPNVWMAPRTGDWMLELFPGPNGTESAYQEIEFGADVTEYLPLVDDDTPMKIKVSGQNGAETVAVRNHFRFRFYDAANSLIGEASQEPQYMYGKGFWGPFEYTAEVPALTRKVRVEVMTTNTSDNARARAVWDMISVRMYEESYENQDNYLAYGKVEFVCTLPGVTSTSIPSFDYTPGNVTLDGTAQWTAVTPLHMFTAPITEVISNKQFKVASLNKPDDWFEWGVIEILQGLNVKKKMEVMKWDNVTKIITLALPLPYIPIVGENLRIHTGCAKTRSVCTSKFNNIVNYRGEPDLPGTDQYFKIGGANVGSTSTPGKS